MNPIFYLADRNDVARADDLIRAYGIDAAFEASERADHCRQIGNHLHFCRWRQIERLILVLSNEVSCGTVH